MVCDPAILQQHDSYLKLQSIWNQSVCVTKQQCQLQTLVDCISFRSSLLQNEDKNPGYNLLGTPLHSTACILLVRNTLYIVYTPNHIVPHFHFFCAHNNVVCKSSQQLEQLRHENEDLQMQFFQQGKELISRNKQSLAAEMENASKEEVCCIRRTLSLCKECLALPYCPGQVPTHQF